MKHQSPGRIILVIVASIAMTLTLGARSKTGQVTIVPSPSSAGTSSVRCAPSWQTVLPVSPGTVDSLWGLAAVSATDVWAVGKTDVPDGPLLEHWDGAAWTTFPAKSFFSAVSCMPVSKV